MVGCIDMASRATDDRSDRNGERGSFAERHPEVVERVRSLRLRRDRKLARLSAMPRREQRGYVRKLLCSGSLHFLYAYEALRAKGVLEQADAERIEAVAAQCNPFQRTWEPISVRYIEHAGRTRRIQDYGPIKRMHHRLVADVLRKLHPPRQDQFLFNGGMPMALKAIEAAFRDGHLFAAEVDLIDFYGKVRLPGLADLLRPLPGAVTDNVVWDHASRRSPDDDYAGSTVLDDPSSSGLVGLSLGAATSPIVGEIIIRRLLDKAQLGQVVTYADNILILGRGPEEVAEKVAHLREVAASLEAGPLELRNSEPVNFRARAEAVTFAGQWGRAIRHRLNWSPNDRKMAEHWVTATERPLTLDEISAAERKLVDWRRGYPMWRTGDRLVERTLGELACLRYFVDARPQHLVAARQQLIVAYMTNPLLELDELVPEGWTARARERRASLVADAGAAIARAEAGRSARAA
jgi:hypothetical protein